MINAYKKFTKVISGQILLAWVSSLILALGFAIGKDKPIDNPLEFSKGLITSYSFSRGSDFSFDIKSSDNINLKLKFSNFRSRMDGKIENYVGKEIIVQHYARLVANCWIGENQVCFAKCESDLQCRISEKEVDNKIFIYFALINAASLAIIFVWAVFIRK